MGDDTRRCEKRKVIESFPGILMNGQDFLYLDSLRCLFSDEGRRFSCLFTFFFLSVVLDWTSHMLGKWCITLNNTPNPRNNLFCYLWPFLVVESYDFLNSKQIQTYQLFPVRDLFPPGILVFIELWNQILRHLTELLPGSETGLPEQ